MWHSEHFAVQRYQLDLPIAGFRYYLLLGSVARAADTFHGLEAHLWWPDDHSWYVATHFDFPCIHLDGTTGCIDDVLHSHAREAWPATASQMSFVRQNLANVATVGLVVG